MAEPLATALLMTTFGALVGISVLFSRAIERLGIPVVLLFLLLGMIAGSQGLGGLEFDNYPTAFRLGTMALVLILFDGGLNTPLSSIRRAILPAGILATIGVAGTAALMALFVRLLGFSWGEALLLGAVVSSTDAAAVFAVLRGGSIKIKKRIGDVLEIESGINDPMAVILTVTLMQTIIAGSFSPWSLVFGIPLQLAIGAAVGIALGHAGRWTLNRSQLSTGGLYPVATLALAFIAFGAATVAHGSGFLAVYVAALVLGNGRLPYRNGLTRVHDSIAWLSQITMFLMLGLLVFPADLMSVGVWAPGLAIGLFLAFIARPIVVAACLAPLGYRPRDILYMGWVGLRGAVPIILATFPLMAQSPGAERLFNLVFFAVVVNVIVPGSTIRWATRFAGLEVPDIPTPAAVLEINSTRSLDGEVMSFYIDHTLVVCDVALSSIAFPPGSAAILLVRGHQLVACRGNTVLRAGDHLYVFCHPSDKPFIQLLFGRPQGET